MRGNELTAEFFFKTYLRNREKLRELEYELARIDDVIIQTTQYRYDKVQASLRNHTERRIHNRQEVKARLEWKVEQVKSEIDRAERAMRIVGDNDEYRISYLKRRYIDKHSYNKIATNYGIGVTKVKRIIKETEEILCTIAR